MGRNVLKGAEGDAANAVLAAGAITSAGSSPTHQASPSPRPPTPDHQTATPVANADYFTVNKIRHFKRRRDEYGIPITSGC